MPPHEGTKRTRPAWWPNSAVPSWRTVSRLCTRPAWLALTSTASTPRCCRARPEFCRCRIRRWPKVRSDRPAHSGSWRPSARSMASTNPSWSRLRPISKMNLRCRWKVFSARHPVSISCAINLGNLEILLWVKFVTNMSFIKIYISWEIWFFNLDLSKKLMRQYEVCV